MKNILKSYNFFKKGFHLICIILCFLPFQNGYSQEISFTKVFTLQDGLDQRSVRRVLRDDYGKFWIFTDVSIQVFDGENFETIAVPKNFRPDKCTQIETHTGNLIALISDEQPTYFLNTFSLEFEVSDIKNVDTDIASLESLLNRIPKIDSFIKNDYDTTIIRKDNFGRHLVCFGKKQDRRYFDAILFDSSNIISYSFILKDPKSDTIYADFNTFQDFYSDDFTQRILIGTLNGLVYLQLNNYIKTIFVNEQKDESVFGNVIYWETQRSIDSNIYFGRETGGLFKIIADTFHQIFPNIEHPSAFRYSYLGKYLAQSDNLLSLSFGRDTFTMYLYNFKNDLQKIEIPYYGDFIEVNQKYVLLVGDNGLVSLLDIDKFKIVDNIILDSLQGDNLSITMINDSYLIGGKGGMYNLEIGIESDRLEISNKKKVFEHYVTACQGYEDVILVGTYENGFYSLDHHFNVLKHVDVSSGLSDNRILDIGIDNSDNIWILTLKGAIIINPEMIPFRTITKHDGLSVNELNTGSFYCDIKGNVYLGSINGLNIVSPEWLEFTYTSLKLIFENIEFKKDGYLSYFQPDEFNNVRIPYRVDEITLNFSEYDFYKSEFNNELNLENSFIGDNNDRYIYSKDKIDIHNIKEDINIHWNVKQTGLLGGSYSTNILIENESFIEKYALLLLLTFLFLLFTSVIIMFRRSKKRDKKRREEAKMESILISSRLDALRAQMNPHFIFNALGSIQYYIQKQETESAEEYLTDFAGLMRLILESSKKDTVNLKEEIELLKLYVKLEHLRFDQKFDFTFQYDEELDFDFQIPPMAIQPFVENAINHGLYHLQNRKGVLSITFKQISEDEVHCIIKDNGVGRKRASELRTKQHASRAMQIVKERIELLSKINNQIFSIEVIDSMDGDKPIGTEAHLRFKDK